MGQRKNPRLAYCEYVLSNSEQSTAVQMARRDLMDAVRRVHRQMLERLSQHVFPAYCELAQSGFDFDTILWHPQISPYTKLPPGRLKSALDAWAKEFHANQDWFLDEILRTLNGWWIAPDWREPLRTNPIVTAPPSLAVGEPFSFSHVAWDPQLYFWADYGNMVRKDFEQKLSEYEARGRKLAESRGLILAPRQSSLVNLDWFALYQFAGLSSTETASRNSCGPVADKRTVLMGIQAAARLLDWSQLRKAQRGRPRGRHKAS